MIQTTLVRKKELNWWSKITARLRHLPLMANLIHRSNSETSGEVRDGSLAGEDNKSASRSVPRHYSLDNFIEMQAVAEGVAVATLAPFDTIHVYTAGGNFRLYLIDPEERRVMLEDDDVFVKPREVTVSGSTMGGSMLKAGWIGVGLFLELHAGALRLTTPIVLSLRIEHDITIRFAA
jgi:hypothetical protein